MGRTKVCRGLQFAHSWSRTLDEDYSKRHCHKAAFIKLSLGSIRTHDMHQLPSLIGETRFFMLKSNLWKIENICHLLVFFLIS